MLKGSSIEVSEVYYTRGMQGDAQMTKPTPNRPDVGQNSSKISWDDGFERHKNGTHAMAHKQGIKVQLSNTLKE